MPEGKTEFKRNKETGILEVWRGGKKIGEIVAMGGGKKIGEIVAMGDEVNGRSSDQ